MRGGLDDALDKLARRDELRRRAVGEATGTPPAVQELVEAIAGVVGRNQGLEVTVGVEGVGDPTLLHFFVEDGMVRVTADSTVASRLNDPQHADFDLEPEEQAEDQQFAARPASPAAGFDERDLRAGYGGQHGFEDEETDPIDPSRFRSPFAATPPPPVPPQTVRAAAAPPSSRLHYDDARPASPAPPSSRLHYDDARPSSPAPHEARLRHDDNRPSSPAPHEARFGYDDARVMSGRGGFGDETTRLAYAQQQPIPDPRAAADPQRGMPTPLPEPVRLRNVDTEETEQAARRLAALLRDDPSLLRQERP